MPTVDHFTDILTKKIETKTLGHFYILEGASENELEEELEIFLKAFIKKEYIQKNKILSLTSPWKHPDLLLITPNEEKKEYLVEDFKEQGFFDFIELRSFELSWRFIIIKEASTIGPTLSNKLLKTLEDPPSKLTIFFLNPQGKTFLKTIQSRAITLRLKLSKKAFLGTDLCFSPLRSSLKSILEEKKKNLNFKEKLSKIILLCEENHSHFPEILEALKGSDRQLQRDFLGFLLDIEKDYISTFEHKTKFLNALEWFETSQIYHNSASERFFQILMSFKTP